MAAKKNATAVQAISYYIDHPAEWCEDILGVTLEPWQRETLTALATDPKKRVSVGSGHGIGKTALEAMAILWFQLTRPNPKIVCTAPTGHQLNDILWPELSKWINKSPALKSSLEWTKTRLSMRGHEERWWAVPVSVSNPESFAGFHEDHILIVVDEASGVDEVIYDTIEGTLTTSDARLLICGNPTRTSGQLYEAVYGRLRPFYWHRQVSCFDSSRVSDSYPLMIERKYGKASDVYRVRVLGLPPKSEPDVFIGLELVEKCVNIEPVTSGHRPQVGVDVARFGDDETVIATRVEGVISIRQRAQRQDTQETARQTIAVCRELLSSHASVRVVVDDVGVGGGVTDCIRDIVARDNLSIEVVGANNGAGSPDPAYLRWGDYAWGLFKRLLSTGGVSLPDDDDLRGQLTGRKYRLDSRGRIVLESKSEMKKRGVSSPDIADAVVMACADADINLISTFNPRRHIVIEPWIARDVMRWRSIWARPNGEYVCLWMAVLPDGQRIVYQSLRERDTTVERFCTLVRRVTGTDPIGYTVQDPFAFRKNQITEESWSDEFRRNGVSVTQGAADVQRGISALLSAFAPPFGAKPLVIAEDCADLVGEIQRWHEGEESEEERYPMVSALWRLLVEEPRYREASARGVSRIDYPAPDVP